MKIEILNSAKKDLSDGAKFYESSERGLGSYFLDSLFSEIDSLLIYAGVHQVVNSGLYRMYAKRFPFAVYYKQDTDFIRVYAVLDTRRKPAWTRNRIERLKNSQN
ncbi:MAG: type II toxin-antitoxin system RelE/ParE family toxin [Kangiellaceae bacterium]